MHRESTGRFVVQIPFKKEITNLGGSKEMALTRFEKLEKRLSKDESLKRKYSEFMAEYKANGHMKEILQNLDSLEDNTAYYMPHRAVIKEESITTKCRVVFDGSAKTNNNLSLNDVQHVGPTVQSELLDILLRFRRFAFVMSADITKMYRQVLIDPNQTKFQRIFWRENQYEEMRCFELLTVTYGLAASAFLATRCLLQLAIENKETFPEASQVITNSFYVDDLLTGRDSQNELLKLQTEISSILASAGFPLHKWLSNSEELQNLFQTNANLNSSVLNIGENDQNKTLGVYWSAKPDTLNYRINPLKRTKRVTKRQILSIVSQIFDPMGLVQPVVMRAKMLLQMLWRENLNWDQPVSDTIQTRFEDFCHDLQALNRLEIPRYALHQNVIESEIHVFSDASEKGYGACIYLRCNTGDDTYFTKLLCAKGRVAPIKQVTLPRLELCAALLGAKLAQRVKNALKVDFARSYFWTDSMITYHWIQSSPERWKTFVSNRVSVIQCLTDASEWRHVRSQDNPADCISRGISASEIKDKGLWWHGPPWLSRAEREWTVSSPTQGSEQMPDQRKVSTAVCSAVTTGNEEGKDLFSRFSSLNRLRRVVAYCLRFKHNAKKPEEKIIGPLNVDELQHSLETIIKLAQQQSFASELRDLREKGCVKQSSSILSLHPFIDSTGIIRVGGRLLKANISFNKKHPIILSCKHPLARLILNAEHWRLFHCGPQHLLYSVREKYWITPGRNLARDVVHKCVICFKAKPKLSEYVMGNLPTERVNLYVPFTHVGCDYAGPFLLKDRKTRKPILTKAWVCIFVCLGIKAVHLELVTDLTTNSFLECFRRFVARRGRPAKVFSDNGTAFVGASKEIIKFLKKEKEIISESLSNDSIEWKFIPPRAPSFGGLWEAGVKSVKHHLKRVIPANTHLHYENFMTVLTGIEAVLNSRPLSPLSSNPSDFIVL